MSSNPIRVMHVITRMIRGGAQENTLTTVERFSDKPGYEVFLVSGFSPGTEGSLEDRLPGLQAEFIRVPELVRELSPWRDSVALSRLAFLFRRYRPDILHTHSSKAGILGRLAARLAGIPAVVHTIHGLPFHPWEKPWRNRVFAWSERWSARRTDILVVVAEAMREQALRQGVGRPAQYRLVYSGIDWEPFRRATPEDATRFRRRFDLGADDLVLGKAARLFPLKGHEYLLRVLPGVLRRHPRLKLLCVGDGPLRPVLERQARDLGVAEAVRWTGSLSPEEIPAALLSCDAVAHVSLREGLARVLPQAVFLGKPVAGFAVDGMSEFLAHTGSGVAVPPGREPELEEALSGLLEKVTGGWRPTFEARAWVAREFSLETMVNRLDLIYHEALRRSHRETSRYFRPA